MAETNAAEQPIATPKRLSRLRAGCAGCLVGLAAVVAFWFIPGGGTLSEIDTARLQQARETWADAKILDYELTVEVQVRKTDTYRVVVRDGLATEAWLNDRPLVRRHAFETWSVAGMFETLDEDVRRNEDIQRGQSSYPHVNLRGDFHPQWGYPTSVVRIESRAMGGANPEVTWKVTAFTRH